MPLLSELSSQPLRLWIAQSVVGRPNDIFNLQLIPVYGGRPHKEYARNKGDQRSEYRHDHSNGELEELRTGVQRVCPYTGMGQLTISGLQQNIEETGQHRFYNQDQRKLDACNSYAGNAHDQPSFVTMPSLPIRYSHTLKCTSTLCNNLSRGVFLPMDTSSQEMSFSRMPTRVNWSMGPAAPYLVACSLVL